MSYREPGYRADDDFGPHPHDQWAARPKKKKGGCLKIAGIAVAAVFVLGGLATCAGGSDSTAPGSSSPDYGPTTTSEPIATPGRQVDPPPAMEVSAQGLLDELEANALAAKTKYKGQRVAVTGEVSNIDASGKYFSIDGGEISFTSIMCRIKGEELTAVVAGLSNGQKVTVTGTITDVGEIMGYTLQTEALQTEAVNAQ